MASKWNAIRTVFGLKRDGSAGADDGEDLPGYRLIQPVSASENTPEWHSQFPDFDEVVGYSDLQHLFLHNSSTGEFAVLHPFRAAIKNYGAFADISRFEAEILKDAGFRFHVLQIPHVQAICKRLGALEEGECYIPSPYPFMGGSEEVETYSKGDFWVALQVIAYLHEL